MVSTANRQSSPDPSQWIVEGLLQSNTLTVLVSPKAGGGQALMRQLAADAVGGAPFLDLHVVQAGPVLFLRRDTATSALHLEQPCAVAERAPTLVIPPEATGRSDWEAVVRRIAEHAAEVGSRLLVVDGILEGLPPLPDSKDPKTLAMLDPLLPLAQCARDGLTVVVLVELDLAPNTRASRSILSAWRALSPVGGCLLLRRVGGPASQVRRLDTSLAGWQQRGGLLYAIGPEGEARRLTPRPVATTPPELDRRLLVKVRKVVRDNPNISGRMVRRLVGGRSGTVVAAIKVLKASGELGCKQQGGGRSHRLVMLSEPDSGT